MKCCTMDATKCCTMDVESWLSGKQLCSFWSSFGKAGAHESAVEPLCICPLCPSCCWRMQPQAPGERLVPWIWQLWDITERVLCPLLGASGQGWHNAAIQQRDIAMIRRMEHIIDRKWICEKKAKRSYCCLQWPNGTVERRQSWTVLKSDRSCRGRMIVNKLDKLEHSKLQLGENKNFLLLGWSNIGTDSPQWLWYCCPWKYSEHSCNCSRSAHIHDVVQILFSCLWQA